MTDDELFAAIDNLKLSTKMYIKFSPFEATSDMPQLVALAKERIRSKLPGADTQRGVLLRVLAHYKGQ